jgi:hypothetical protein
VSYDIYICPEEKVCPTCGHVTAAEADVQGGSFNYTSNMSPAWREAGILFHEWHHKPVREVLDALRSGIATMEAHKDEYARRFDSPNGWGSMETLLPFLKSVLAACERCPDGRMEVSR